MRIISYVMSCIYYVHYQVCDELISKWSDMSGDDQHIPLGMHLSALVMKTLTRYAFGDYFNSDQAIYKFREDYDLVSSIRNKTA